MNQKEAIVAALQSLGGRASLTDIYSVAYSLADWSGSKNWKATLRWYLQKDTQTFRPYKHGWWELTSYQEEMAALMQEIAALKGQLAEKDKVIEQQKQVPTEDAFVKRMLEVTKTLFKYERGKADGIRQVMAKMGRDDAEADLDEWIEGRRPQTRIKADKIEVQGNLNVRQLNEVHDNDNVEIE